MYGNRCYYCGRGGGKLQKEHRVPLARGGDNYISNIVPSCESCNRRKGIRTDDEFFKLLADEHDYSPAGSDSDSPSRPFPGVVADDGSIIRIPLKRPRTIIDLPPGMKRCPKCTRVLPIESFGKHKGKSDGLTSRCKECNATAMRQRRLEVEGETSSPSSPNQPRAHGLETGPSAPS
jgi:hypothetical protein